MDSYLRIRMEILNFNKISFFSSALCPSRCAMSSSPLAPTDGPVTFWGPSHSIRMIINHGGNSVADWKHHLGAARGALPGTCQGAGRRKGVAMETAQQHRGPIAASETRVGCDPRRGIRWSGCSVSAEMRRSEQMWKLWFWNH